jgi:hypothetical protein
MSYAFEELEIAMMDVVGPCAILAVWEAPTHNTYLALWLASSV